MSKKTNLVLHLILVTKYRRKLIEIINTLEEILKTICNEMSIDLLELKVLEDHTHMLIKYQSNMSVSELVMNIKSESTIRIWRLIPLQKYYWKKKILWSDGYFASSIGEVNLSVIKNYIINNE
jgi:putative transposase